MANVKIEPSWHELLADEFEKPYFEQLTAFVREQYMTHVVYPPAGDIFRAFNCCPADRLKVVIIGQDPYYNEGQANGLCFSVAPGTQFPPSLQNIFKEVCDDTGVPMPTTGELDRWAEQGVLMLYFACGTRLGGVYGRSRPDHRSAEIPCGLYALGIVRTTQGGGGRPFRKLYPHGSPSVAVVGVPGLFRLSPV